jgi:Zn-dependent protease
LRPASRRIPFPPLDAPSPYPRSVAPEPPRDRVWLHVLLFLATLATTALAGGQFAGRIGAYTDTPLAQIGPNDLFGTWGFWLDGLRFAGSLLLFLTVHEFGHYIAARKHRLSASLPYYIPLPLIGFGTLGAVIRIREVIPTSRKLFDVGAAGPLAGFVAALGILVYALATLPPPSYLLDVPGHEALKSYILTHDAFPPEMLGDGEGGLLLIPGQTPLYWGLSQLFPNVPPMYEMLHYPVLFAAWLGLLFTAINLLPVGQLDGGHILYALVGPVWHRRLARGFVLLLLASGSIGFAQEIVPALAERGPLWKPGSWFILAAILYYFLSRVYAGVQRLIAPSLLGLVTLAVIAPYVGLGGLGYTGWLVWCLLIVILIKIEHPPVPIPQKLTPTRRLLAWLSIVIFILCFSPVPISTSL